MQFAFPEVPRLDDRVSSVTAQCERRVHTRSGSPAGRSGASAGHVLRFEVIEVQ